MFSSFSNCRPIARGLLASAVLVGLSASSAFAWTHPWGDETRANHYAGSDAAGPPLSLLGDYGFEGMAAFFSELLVSSNRMFNVSELGITAVRRKSSWQIDGPYIIDDEDWQYGPGFEEPLPDTLVQLKGEFSLHSGNVVFLEQRVENVGQVDQEHRFAVVAISQQTGEETWRYESPVEATILDILNVNGTLFVRYAPTDAFQTEDTHRVMRIPFGAEEPTHTQTMSWVSTDRYPVASRQAGLFYSEEDRNISAFHLSDLSRAWDFTIHEDGSGLFLRGMLTVGSDLILARNDAALFSIDSSGEENWSVPVPDPGEDADCSGAFETFLASDGETLIVSGICSDRLFAFDVDSGNHRWTAETSFHNRQSTPLIAGGVVYLPVIIDFLSNTPGLAMFDIETGDLIDEIETVGNAPHFHLAALGENLFAIANGIPPLARIVSYEREPARVTARFGNPGIVACGAYEGEPFTFWIDVINEGPGVAPNPQVRMFTGGVPFDYVVPEGVEYDVGLSRTTFSIPDLDPFEVFNLELQLTPQVTRTVELSVHVETDVRNPAANEGDHVRFQVFSPLPPDLDIWIEQVEITQGIQDQDNSIPIIAQRPLLVRALVGTSAPVEGVHARMNVTGMTDAKFYSNEHAPLLNDCLTLTSSDPDRGDLNASFNFILPPEMLNRPPGSSFDIDIMIDPANALGETNRDNNSASAEIEFVTMPPVCLMTHSVRTYANFSDEVIPGQEIPDDILRRAESLLPVSDIHVIPTGNVIERFTVLGYQPYSLDPGGTSNDFGMMSSLWFHRWTTSDPAICRNAGGPTHHVGIVDEDNLTTHPDGNQFNGLARTPGRYMAFRIRRGGLETYTTPAGGATLAHELAHNYGRRHIDCGGPQNPDPNYPYDPCVLSPLSNGVFYGTDLMTLGEPVIIAPREGDEERPIGDLLSYAGRRWTSDYTWMAVYNEIRSESRRHEQLGFLERNPRLSGAWNEPLARSDTGRLVLLTGAIYEDGSGELGRILPLSESAVPQERSVEMAESLRRAARRADSPMVDLLDDQGGVIASVPVEADWVEDGNERFRLVGAMIPEPDGLAGIRLSSADHTQLDSAERSDAAPEVELHKPQSGETVDEVLEIEWTATDADGDELSAMILYSPDNGATWRTLVTDAPGSSYAYDAGLLPGAAGTARIRLVVSDGFNTTEVTSDAFTVLARAPIVRIDPRPGDTAFPEMAGPSILLRGSAFDPEDGPLVGESLVWEIEGIGEIGTGGTVLVADLEPGEYLVTLTAEDSDGLTGFDEILLIVTDHSIVPESDAWLIH